MIIDRKMKSCPFCGSNIIKIFVTSSRTGIQYITARCEVCHAKGPEFICHPDRSSESEGMKEDALNAWNQMSGGSEDNGVLIRHLIEKIDLLLPIIPFACEQRKAKDENNDF